MVFSRCSTFYYYSSIVTSKEKIIITNQKLKVYNKFPYLIGKKIKLKDITHLHTTEERYLRKLVGNSSNFSESSLIIIEKGNSLIVEYKGKEFRFGKDLDNPEALFVYDILDKKIRRAQN